MANTASAILWPRAPQTPSTNEHERDSEWMFYSRVSVSGPSVCTTVHRGGRTVRGASPTIDQPEVGVEREDGDRDPNVSSHGRDDDRQWGPWSLTQRELEVLQLLAEGATNSEISQRLYISPKTTKNHLAAIFQKLDVTNRTHALVRAVVMGLVTIE
jgi:DNA-binding CsgD family transcriptional regulator